jgi:hypothetical protein
MSAAPAAATAVTAATVTVGLNGSDIEAQGRQENHPGRQGNPSSALGPIHNSLLA